MRLVMFLMLVTVLMSCGAGKKSTGAAAEAERQAQFDYQTALHHYKVGINDLNNKDVVSAVENLRKAVTLDNDNFRYHHGLGLAFSLNGQLDDAIRELQTALAINPESSESYNLMGTVYIDMERYDQAIQAFKKVIQDNSYGQPYFAYFNLGKCFRSMDRTNEAIASFKRAVQLNSDFHRAYIALAEIYKKHGDFQRSLAYFKKAEPGFSNNPEVLYEIGHSHFKLKQYAEAQSYLAQVAILFPPPAIDKPTQDMLRYIEKVRSTRRR